MRVSIYTYKHVCMNPYRNDMLVQSAHTYNSDMFHAIRKDHTKQICFMQSGKIIQNRHVSCAYKRDMFHPKRWLTSHILRTRTLSIVFHAHTKETYFVQKDDLRHTSCARAHYPSCATWTALFPTKASLRHFQGKHSVEEHCMKTWSYIYIYIYIYIYL